MPEAGTIPIKSYPQILNENRTNDREVRIGYRETYWRVWAIGRGQQRVWNFCTLHFAPWAGQKQLIVLAFCQYEVSRQHSAVVRGPVSYLKSMRTLDC
jgi:hypothetical protein